MAGKRLKDKEAEIHTILTRRSQENWEVRYYDEVSTTMEAARTILAELNSGSSAIVVADSQTAGKGRQGREWQSLQGNLMATYAFYTEVETKNLSGLSLVVGLALQNYLSTIGCRVRLKWPNDIVTTNGKKLAGILSEVVPFQKGHYILIGIGLNIAEKPAGIELTTSVKEMSEQTLPPFEVAAKLSATLQEQVNKFFLQGFSAFQQQWMQNAAYVGRDISVHIAPGKKITGMLLDVTKEGLLRVVQDGKIEVVPTGDVELIGE